MKTIAVINQKGGVGKTTTTVNLGAALARLGSRVLLLDLDPQSNLTLHVDRKDDVGDKTMTRLLVDDRPIEELLQETHEPNVSVIPADTTLGGVEQSLANRIGRETILREAFEAYRGLPFDFCLIDCPPSLGVLSANALCAADEVIVPLQTEYFSLQGMAKLTEVIELVQRRLNPTLQILCVLPCMVDLRTRLTTEVLENVRGYFGNRLARTLIRSNVKLAEAPSFGVSIFSHAPESNGAIDYWCFGLEVLERHGLHVSEEQFREIAGDLVADQIYGEPEEGEPEDGDPEEEQPEEREPEDRESDDEDTDSEALDADLGDETSTDEVVLETSTESPAESSPEPSPEQAPRSGIESLSRIEAEAEPDERRESEGRSRHHGAPAAGVTRDPGAFEYGAADEPGSQGANP